MSNPSDENILSPGFKVTRFGVEGFAAKEREAMGLGETEDLDTWFTISIRPGLDLSRQIVRIYLKLDLMALPSGKEVEEDDPGHLTTWPLSENTAASIQTEMIFENVETSLEDGKPAVGHVALVGMVREAVSATKGAFVTKMAGTSYQNAYPPMFSPEQLIFGLAEASAIKRPESSTGESSGESKESQE